MPIRRRKPTKRKPTNLSPLTESELEQKFHNLLVLNNLRPVQQHKFHPIRNWRFDFAWPLNKLAIEVQGYGPGHTSYTGMLGDYEKHNEAIIHGWRILYFMSRDVEPYNQANTVALIRLLLNAPTRN